MEAKDWILFLERMGWSDSEASRQLEISRNTIATFRVKGAGRSVALACAALVRGLAPWPN